MTEREMAIIQSGNTVEIRAMIEQRDTAIAEKDRTIEFQRELLNGKLELIGNGVDYLVDDRKKRKAANKERGKDNQGKGCDETRERAAEDMKSAIRRVHDNKDVRSGKHGALLKVCRRVCKKFKPITTKKNSLGEYEAYTPLTGTGGEEIKPETLAKNYRAKHGTLKKRKSRAVVRP